MSYVKKSIDQKLPDTCRDLTGVADQVLHLDYFKKTTADAYMTIHHVLVHELTHTSAGGRTDVSILCSVIKLC